MNTWANGLNPRYAELSDVRALCFFRAYLAEKAPASFSAEQQDLVDKNFLMKIIERRIEACRLPIRFSYPGKLAALALVDRPGAAVTLLIDCLNAYEGQEVTAKKLSELYPSGFYDEKTLIRYIDKYLKPNRVKWAELY